MGRSGRRSSMPENKGWLDELYCWKVTHDALKERMAPLERVAEVAKRFVPPEGTIQWESREIELRDALAALEEYRSSEAYNRMPKADDDSEAK